MYQFIQGRVASSYLFIFLLLLSVASPPVFAASFNEVKQDIAALGNTTAAYVGQASTLAALGERLDAADRWIVDADQAFQQSDAKGTRKALKYASEAMRGYRKIVRNAVAAKKMSPSTGALLLEGCENIIDKVKQLRHERVGDNEPPVADAGPDQTVAVGATVSLDAAGSHDPEGQPLTFSWTLTGPDGGAWPLMNADTDAPSFVASVPGTYRAILVVNDGLLDSDPDEVVIDTSNSAPVANAGPDQSGSVGTIVILDGQNSYDVDGDALTFQWTLINQPIDSTAILQGATTATPSLELDAPGEYFAELVVNDGLLDSAADVVVVSTINSPPTANAGPDQAVPLGSVVAIDGSASSDIDGDQITFAWSILSKPAGSLSTIHNPSAVTTSMTLDVAGEYLVQLIVSDSVTDSAPDTVKITTTNTRPIAVAGDDQTVPVGTTVLLDGGASIDADGDPLAYMWSLVGVPEGSTAALYGADAVLAEFDVDLPGAYQAQLIVSDGDVSSAPDLVTISTINSPPVADAGPDLVVFEGQTATLDGSGSYDVDGDVLTYVWSLITAPEGSTAALADPNAPVTQLIPDLPGTYLTQLVVADGQFSSNPDTALITVEVQPNQPPQINSAAVTTARVNKLYQYAVIASDPEGGPIAFSLETAPAGMTVDHGGLITWVPSSEGAASVVVIAQDILGLQDRQTFTVQVGAGDGTPPDPSWLAPPLSSGTNAPFSETIDFLYAGDNPIQTGVAPGAIVAERVAVVRGRVTDREGVPIPAVTISIHGYPEFGQTLTRNDGYFDMAVNGGHALVVNYAKTGLLPSQRRVETVWNDYSIADDVVLIPLDSQVTTIELANPPAAMQVAHGSPQTDVDGTRRATVLFPVGTTAEMTLPDGSVQSLSTITVRATEYTVGEAGQRAMPGELPPTSAYTYAVELSVDEAMAAGATRVDFDRALAVYVDNFLGFPIGEAVPSGWYNRDTTTWEASANGRVIKIVGTNGGLAELDVTGAGAASSDTELSQLGITDDERLTLASNYPVGHTLWRVPVSHFTPWDFNWPYGPPEDATPPPDEDPERDDEDEPEEDPCEQGGCVVQPERQVLQETFEVAGTPFALHYSSDRVPGRNVGRSISIPLSGESIPASVKQIVLKVQFAGRYVEQSFTPQANLRYEFQWDGKDSYGRVVSQGTTAYVKVEYVYDATYYSSSTDFGNAFGVVSTLPTGGNDGAVIGIGRRAGLEIGISRNVSVFLSGIPSDYAGLGGLSIDSHHFLSKSALLLGDASRRMLDTYEGEITTLAGRGGLDLFDSGIDNGSELRDFIFFHPRGLTIGPDGAVYIADDDRLITIDTSGYGSSRYIDKWEHPRFLSFPIVTGEDGAIVGVTQGSHSVKRLAPDGTITMVAGSPNGVSGYAGDGGPATEALLNYPVELDRGPDGSLYIADRNNRAVRRISPDGIITTVLRTANLFDRVKCVAVGEDGIVYAATGGSTNNRIIELRPDGSTADIGGISPSMDIVDLAVFGDGTLYFADGKGKRIYAVRDGAPALVAGGGESFYLERALATEAVLGRYFDDFSGELSGEWSNEYFQLAETPTGDLLLLQEVEGTLRRVGAAQTALVASEDATQVYRFVNGQHVETLDALTGATLLTFEYDGGELSGIVDAYDNRTQIDRSDPSAIRIVSPDGQHTVMTLDASGYADTVQLPGNIVHRMVYRDDGLLTKYTDPNGNIRQYSYDGRGLLTQDLAPNGGGWLLDKADNADGSTTVAATSGEGRVTLYQSERNSDGSLLRQVTHPDGSGFQWLTKRNGEQQTIHGDGTIVVAEKTTDPRFGMQAPVAESTVTTLPSGLARTASTTRIAALSNPNDPLSLTQLTESTTVNDKTTVDAYDAVERLWTFTTPEGRKSYARLDGDGRVAESWVEGFSAVTHFGYDLRGRLASLSQTDGLGLRETEFTYDPGPGPHQGFLNDITDAEGRTVGFAYDAAGRVGTQQLPDQREILFDSDANGNMIELIPPGRPAHSFVYDNMDQEETYVPPPASDVAQPATRYSHNKDQQITLVERPDGRTVTFDYHPSKGQLASLAIGRGSYGYTYDTTTALLHQIVAPDGGVLSYEHDGPLLTRSLWAGAVGGSVERSYNNDFLVAQRCVNNTLCVDFSFDKDQLLVQAGAMVIAREAQKGGVISGTALGAVADALTYNAFGELATRSATVNGLEEHAVTYQRDRLGRIIEKVETVEGVTETFNYLYDLSGRLAEVQRNGLIEETYEYDENGNRTHINGHLVGTYDAQDRLLTFGAAAYDYTANGELQAKTEGGLTTTYDYDELGNLIQVILPGDLVIDYVIDGQNRRIGKMVNGVLTQGLLFKDELNPIAELDGNGNVVSRFVYADKAHVPAFMIRIGVGTGAETTYRIISDHLGSPRLVIDAATGVIAQRIDYDAWGNVLLDTNPGFQPFGFAGGLFDQQTELLRFGARDYDPVTGRWTAKDSIGFRGGDVNLYSYAFSNPVRNIDPRGRNAITAVAGGIVCGPPCAVIGFALGVSALDALLGPMFDEASADDNHQDTEPDPDKIIDDLVSGSERTNKTSKVDNRTRQGGQAQCDSDFDRFPGEIDPDNPNVKHLPDGRTINKHNSTTSPGNPPSLDLPNPRATNPRNRIKLRYF